MLGVDVCRSENAVAPRVGFDEFLVAMLLRERIFTRLAEMDDFAVERIEHTEPSHVQIYIAATAKAVFRVERLCALCSATAGMQFRYRRAWDRAAEERLEVVDRKDVDERSRARSVELASSQL